ncbi:hypothetical protein GCM10009030_31470 [Haloarcula pellucida]|uniref:Uncharacterized protein n=1 Tax=Haloarcula pellucida TaxID=1427151 RepID=A0A830GN73_9EURY|nr:hypothetical protein GCM10009030_31470 [Halomicroarcula pellucida]
MGSSGMKMGSSEIVTVSTGSGVLTHDPVITHGSGVSGWRSVWFVVGVAVGTAVGVLVGTAVGEAVGVGVVVRVLGCLVVVTGVGEGVAAPLLSLPPLSPSVDAPKSPKGVEMVQPARPPAETAAAVAKSRRLLIVGSSSVISRYPHGELLATTLALRM